MSAARQPLYQQPWPEGDYRFFQLGFMVDDIPGVARRWAEAFGIGPFHVMPVFESSLLYRGEEITLSAQVAVAQAGPSQIELYHQISDTPSVFNEWSREGSCIFHQLATVTSDYEATKAHYEGLGYEVVAENVGSRIRVAYIDTVEAFGFYTEVVEGSRGFLANLGRISAACAEWDGIEPLRYLTADGRAQ